MTEKERESNELITLQPNNAERLHFASSEHWFTFFKMNLLRPHSHITTGFPQTFEQLSLTHNRVLRKQMSVTETKF